MLKRVRHLIAFAWITVALFVPAGAHAASLEKIEVASRLGEPFYAEIPLKLEANESASRIFVEIAAPADYKIFEVYREPVLATIRADVASDQRGTRVELSSRTAISAPFINLVLKIRYGRVAHFKKFPIFLEPPKTTQLAAQKTPLPTVEESDVTTKTAMVEEVATEAKAAVEEDVAAEGWARTDQYGPIVHGDVLSTVVQRLRKDHRYRPYQVMVALFEKNKSKFEYENMNLLRAGSFLKVPSAAEVEQRTAKEAYQLFAEHEKEWKSLTSQPRYAAVEEAQKTRYSKRVSIGEQAGGSTAAPVSASLVPEPVRSVEPVQPEGTASMAPATAVAEKSLDASLQTDEQASSVQDNSSAQLVQLKAENEVLQQQLLENQQSIAALNSKMDEVASAASKARIEKLEVLLTRLQAELDRSNNKAQSMQSGPDLIVWLLLTLIVILLGFVAVLMRREPKHPSERVVEEEPVVSGAAAPAAAATTLAAVAASETQAGETDKEPDVFDSISNFADDLTDTDTAEMEPFDASALEEDPDPNVDYLSEADVYIRYGMNDEALHQLDMALRLDPAHAAAHIKKTTLLQSAGDQAAYEVAISEAALVLDTDELEKLKALSNDVDADELSDKADVFSEDITTPHEQEEVEAADLLESPIKDDGINFDLSDIEVPDKKELSAHSDDAGMDWLHDNSFDEQQQSNAADESIVAGDGDETATQMFGNLLDEFADDQQVKGSEDSSAVDAGLAGAIDEGEMLDLASSSATQDLDHLLSEFSGLDVSEEQGTSAAVEKQSDSADEYIAADGEETATQMFGNLLDEFADDQPVKASAADNSSVDAGFEQSTDMEQTIDLASSSATQDLDYLLSEFSEPDEIGEQGRAGSVPSESEATLILDDEMAETQHLDHLLGEFANDDKLFDFGTEAEELDETVFNKAEAALEQGEVDSAPEAGATQHLDILMSEFAEKDEAASPEELTLDESVSSQLTADNSSGVALELDHGATQELDHLLTEFATADESDITSSSETLDQSVKSSDEVEMDHGATQELDHLLTEFAAADDELTEASQDDREAEPADGAIQELGSLLDEFSSVEEEAFEPDWLSEDAEESGLASEHGATQELDQLLSEFSDDDEDDDKPKS